MTTVLPLLLSVALTTSAAAQPIRSFLDLRYEGVTRQTTWYSCGPAALTTMLEMLGIQADEATVTARAVTGMTERVERPQDGITAFALRQVLTSYGVPAQAYLIDVPTLVRVSTQTKLPILVNVLEPEPHYALVLGVQDGQVILADPALGLRTEPLNSFRTSWNGTAVVVTPSEHQWRRGRAATGSVLARMADRAARLRSVR